MHMGPLCKDCLTGREFGSLVSSALPSEEGLQGWEEHSVPSDNGCLPGCTELAGDLQKRENAGATG